MATICPHLQQPVALAHKAKVEEIGDITKPLIAAQAASGFHSFFLFFVTCNALCIRAIQFMWLTIRFYSQIHPLIVSSRVHRFH